MGLKRAGAVFYAERLYSVLVGALFILIITRNLSTSEFGAWGVVSSILSYASLATIVNFWVTRFRARGESSVLSSGLLLSLIFSLAIMVLLFIFSHEISTAFGIPYEVVLVSIAYLPFYYANSALYSSLYAVNPALAAVSEFVFETVKLAAAVFFATTSTVTLFTAMLAVLAGNAGQTAALLFFTHNDLRYKPSFETIRRILAYSWVNALSIPSSIIALMDVPLLSHFTSNQVVAYYTIVLTYTNLIGYSYVLGKGLYPSLLSNSDSASEKLDEILRFTFLLGVPTMVGAIVLAPNLLYLLNPQYTVASPVLRVAALTALIGVFNGILSDTVQGIESKDAEKIHPKMLARTHIFRITVIGVARALIGIAGVSVVILALRDGVQTALYARVSWLVAEAFVTISLYRMVKGILNKRSFAYSLTKYFLASVPMSLLVFWINPWRIRETFLAVVVGATVYFATLYILDKWFRRTARLVVQELRHKVFNG